MIKEYEAIYDIPEDCDARDDSDPGASNAERDRIAAVSARVSFALNFVSKLYFSFCLNNFLKLPVVIVCIHVDFSTDHITTHRLVKFDIIGVITCQ